MSYLLINNDFLKVSFNKDHIFDLVILDLPYNQTDFKWDENIIDLDKMWIWLKKYAKQNANIVFFCTAKFGNKLINSNNFWFRYDLVWVKNNGTSFMSAKKLPIRKHELIYIFNSPNHKSTYNPQMSIGEPFKGTDSSTNQSNIKKYDSVYGKIETFKNDNNGTRYPTSILKFDKDRNNIHPTQKPNELLQYIINTYSNKNDYVLDPTMGSGSTIKAALSLDRNAVGIEKNKKIFNKAKDYLK
jgi:DNA modification methylase